jgi:crotonobetainyl-CoA:carnitine CoA-transferase CaiB-like acyl-CoA transferase
MSVTGEPGGPPLKNGNPVADINAGILAACGIAAAYAHKLKTGLGQIVDTSLMEAALQQTYWYAAIHFATGRVAGPDWIGAPPHRSLPGVSRKRRLAQHRRLRTRPTGSASPTCLGHPEWRDDARFATNTARLAHLPVLVDAMNAVLATRTKAEWIALFDAAGVPVGPVHSIGEALAHPQTIARGMVVDLDHAAAGPTKALGCPIHFSATPDGGHSTRAGPRRAHP